MAGYDLTIAQHWADGSCTELQVTTEDDALAAALFGIIALWRETCQTRET